MRKGLSAFARRPLVSASTALALLSLSATAMPAAMQGAPCKVAQVYTSPTSDKGWSWSHEQSFLSIKQTMPNIDLSVRKDSVPDDNKQAVIDLLESMVAQGTKVVYTTSFGFMEPTREVARNHPDVMFFHASGYPDPTDPPNIGYYFASIEEGRYITGVVAGLAIPSGTNIGYVAAFPIPEVFRGENAFAIGVAKTNPLAKIHNKWTLTWFDPKLEKDAAEATLASPINAQLVTQHQDSTAAQIAAETAGKYGIAYHADMNDAAPGATLTSATWNWAVHNKPTIEAACSGAWMSGGKVVIPEQYRNWSGTFQDGTVGVAPLNEAALARHPRAEEIRKAYDTEVAAFKSGEKTMVTVFTGQIKDNTGKLRIDGAPDIGKLYDDNGMWFVSNVIGTTAP